MTAPRPFGIGLVGMGNVGTGFVNIFAEKQNYLEERSGGPLVLRAVAVRKITSEREDQLPSAVRLTEKWKDLVNDREIDAIVEVIGVDKDGRPTSALNIAKAALQAGKHFVTANKNLIAAHGPELFTLARKNNVRVRFEASVCAGVPVLQALTGGLSSSRVHAIHGILNGTCNFVLGRMESGLSISEAVKEAQDLGYAEADPSADVDGHDAACKIAILASLAFQRAFNTRDVLTEGIGHLGPHEFEFARRKGFGLKLVASAVALNGTPELTVRPAFLPSDHLLSLVNGAGNGVWIEGDPIGETLLFGPGAGQASTSSGLLNDVVLLSRAFHEGLQAVAPEWPDDSSGARHKPVAPPHKRYLRFPKPADPAKEKALREALVQCTDEGETPADELVFMSPPWDGHKLQQIIRKLVDFGVQKEDICRVDSLTHLKTIIH